MSELSHLTAVILAGGLGTRLRGVLPDQPKVLAPVAGKPFLFHLLQQVAEAGIPCALLCTGYLGDQVQAVCGNRYQNVTLSYSREAQPLGTGGALRLAAQKVNTESMLVLNGDSYCAADWTEFWRWHEAAGLAFSLLLTRVADVTRYGQVRVDGTGRIRSFAEKGSAAGAGWINAGAYLTSRTALLEIPSDRAVSLEREVFPIWLLAGLGGYCAPGRFIDIGTPESYAAAEEFFHRKVAP